MLSKSKYFIIRYSLLIFAFSIMSNVSAQSCQDAVSEARDLYFNQDYDYVHGSLNSCLNDFYYYKRDYVQDGNRDLVFLVYRLVISSLDNLGYYDKADDKKRDLINYFDGILHPEDVMRILDSTKI